MTAAVSAHVTLANVRVWPIDPNVVHIASLVENLCKMTGCVSFLSFFRSTFVHAIFKTEFVPVRFSTKAYILMYASFEINEVVHWYGHYI